ncbi:hypothetical protein HY091_01045 [Candidatus Kaiserbacteria bacterium]|nr:hypothetical protein [Candidatus Kaiserbacteria bacterium]
MRILKKDSYLAMIKNAEGSNLFRTLYGETGGEKQDILRDGDLSCAFFVSSILHHFHFAYCKSPHATVAGLERDLRDSGWWRIEIPAAGDVVFWIPGVQKGGEEHAHVGFSLGGEEAISNDDQMRSPQRHHLTFGTRAGEPVRVIAAIYTRDFSA